MKNFTLVLSSLQILAFFSSSCNGSEEIQAHLRLPYSSIEKANDFIGENGAKGKLFLQLFIDFPSKEQMILDLFTEKNVQQEFLQSLDKIKKSTSRINILLKNKGFHNSIMTELNMIINNHIPKSFQYVTLSKMERELVDEIFGPIGSNCIALQKTLVKPDQDAPARKALENKNKKLQELLLEEQKWLSSSKVFPIFLKKLACEFRTRNPQPNGVYFLYAWPTEKRLSEESWIQGFLQCFKNDLNEAGIDHAKMDIQTNRMGGNIYEYMTQVKSDDYVLMFGTRSLKEKHDAGVANVVVELAHLIEKRENDLKNGQRRIFPILLDGNIRESFPPENERYNTVRDFRTLGYLENFKRVYLELFGLAPTEKRLEICEKLWIEAISELSNSEEIASLVTIQENRKKLIEAPLLK